MDTDMMQQSHDYKRIEHAITYLESHYREQPSLDDIAKSVNLSPYHFSRLFKRWAGISPIQFLHFLTCEYAKRQLDKAESILGTSLASGLSGPGRLHDLFITFEAVTPGEYKRKGEGLTVSYGFGQTPYGECLLAVTERDICYLGFVIDGDRESAHETMRYGWPAAAYIEDTAIVLPLIREVFFPTRSAEPAEELLQNFSGYLQTDYSLHTLQAALLPHSQFG